MCRRDICRNGRSVILKNLVRTRKSTEYPMINLRIITEANFIDAFNLKLGEGQEK